MGESEKKFYRVEPHLIGEFIDTDEGDEAYELLWDTDDAICSGGGGRWFLSRDCADTILDAFPGLVEIEQVRLEDARAGYGIPVPPAVPRVGLKVSGRAGEDEIGVSAGGTILVVSEAGLQLLQKLGLKDARVAPYDPSWTGYELGELLDEMKNKVAEIEQRLGRPRCGPTEDESNS
jgi:hypothetical protein